MKTKGPRRSCHGRTASGNEPRRVCLQTSPPIAQVVSQRGRLATNQSKSGQEQGLSSDDARTRNILIGAAKGA